VAQTKIASSQYRYRASKIFRSGLHDPSRRPQTERLPRPVADRLPGFMHVATADIVQVT